MKRNSINAALLFFAVIAGNAFAQSLTSYHARHAFLLAPPAAFDDGLLGFTNPANVAMLRQSETRFLWSTDGTKATSFNDWGLFWGMRGLGFSTQRQHRDDLAVTEYNLAGGFGSRAFALGMAYNWSTGDRAAFGREKLFTVGSIMRPSRFLSLGLIGNFSTESSNREGIAEIGIRPLGTPRLTLFADAAIQNGMSLSEAPWSAGAALQVLEGMHLVGRTFDSEAFTLGMTINFGKSGIGGQVHFDAGRDHAYNTYMIRAGGVKPSVVSSGKGKRYLAINLKGRMDYHKYVWFDKDTNRLYEILNNIRTATADPQIGLLALNLSAMQIAPEHAWEIREALKQAQAAGKKVIIFIDNAEMTDYHLASVADKVVLDPEGMLTLQGFVLGRTYLKGTLEKMGLGFDEWRFFKYKSAMESLSRDSLSEGDREQLHDFVDDWYELVQREVCAARGLTPERFDQLIDNETLFTAESALRAHLVDTLARWSALSEVIKSFMGNALRSISANDLREQAEALQAWGEPPKIALVYGLGVCAMDEGIRARWLEKVFRDLAKNSAIKAVVFRVDSPGGDGMASDVVAEALKKCSEKKPVIVSQGQVAGSGGYWISMYGDTIVAGPNTITGSIGVIGGWVYDKGFSEKIGMTEDHVKRGAHADAGYGITLPLLGVRVPARNLTAEERDRIEALIKDFYETFVAKVAQGRGMSVAQVKDIAEGRIFSGIDGKANGLVDEVGGMLTALAIAQQRAGIDPGHEIEVVEIPASKGLFNFSPGLPGVKTQMANEPILQFIKFMSERNGQPMPLLVPGMYPE